MNVVNPNNTNHNLKIIPRFYPSGDLVFELDNDQIIDNTYYFDGGYIYLTFELDILEGQKFQIKITENNEVVYRGKLIATSQDTQTFKASKDLYYYE